MFSSPPSTDFTFYRIYNSLYRLLLTSVKEDRVQNMETDVQLTTQHRLHLLQKNIPCYSDLVHVIRVAGSGSYSYILYSTTVL